MTNALTTLTLAAVLSLGLSSAALAQSDDPSIPGHPRVNEVDQRLENQNDRINAGVADGQLNATQAQRLDTRDAKISQTLSADQAKNNGHLTPTETARLNNRLNSVGGSIYRQRH